MSKPSWTRSAKRLLGFMKIGGLQKRVEELQKKSDVFKEKVDGMQGADDARTAELNKAEKGPGRRRCGTPCLL